jgi:acetyl/propionyl-CoA carboxylase alpha subunit
LNHSSTRSLTLSENDKNITVEVTYNEDESFDLKLPESNQSIRVSGKLNGKQLIANVGDKIIQSTVVLHGNDVNIFYEGNTAAFRIPVRDFSASTGQVKGSLLAPMPGTSSSSASSSFTSFHFEFIT